MGWKIAKHVRTQIETNGWFRFYILIASFSGLIIWQFSLVYIVSNYSLTGWVAHAFLFIFLTGLLGLIVLIAKKNWFFGTHKNGSAILWKALFSDFKIKTLLIAIRYNAIVIGFMAVCGFIFLYFLFEIFIGQKIDFIWAFFGSALFFTSILFSSTYLQGFRIVDKKEFRRGILIFILCIQAIFALLIIYVPIENTEEYCIIGIIPTAFIIIGLLYSALSIYHGFTRED